MVQRYYAIGQFAQRAGVSVRTLRYYEQVGLLAPSHRTPAGYRMYTEADLVRLQQILALKFLGFSLQEIRAAVQAGPQRLQPVLAAQKAMLLEQRAQIDAIVGAIDELEQLTGDDHCDWDALVRLIGAIQIEQKSGWINAYFTPEQVRAMRDLSRRSYSQAALRTMASWGYGKRWTEQDQQRVKEQYALIAAELKRLVVAGADPAGPEAQAVARLTIDLERQFTRGDAEVAAGLRRWWEQHQMLPDDQKPVQALWGTDEQAFLERAIEHYHQQNDPSAA